GQAESMRAFLRDPAHAAGDAQLIPVLRARVVGVTGQETNLEGADAVRRSGMPLGREFTITYRDRIEADERIIAGSFSKGPAPEPEVSVERQIPEHARIHVGDTM